MQFAESSRGQLKSGIGTRVEIGGYLPTVDANPLKMDLVT